MKRKPPQPGLFDAEEFPLFFAPEQAAPEQANASEQAGGAPVLHPDYPPRACGAAVTLDCKPAKIIGAPSARYATIEPRDIDADPIRCCWDMVQDVLDNHEGRFQRADDDTDE